MKVSIFHLVIFVVAGKAKPGRGGSAFELELIRGLVGIMTADAILLHWRMNDLLFKKSLFFFMTTQAEIQIGLYQAKTGGGDTQIMAGLTRSLCNRGVDIRSRANFGMALGRNTRLPLLNGRMGEKGFCRW